MAASNYRILVYLLTGFIIISLFTCKKSTSEKTKSLSLPVTPDLLVELNRELTKVVSEDLFPPPVAARVYAYSNIAAYESICPADTSFNSMEETLNGYKSIRPTSNNIAYQMALITSYTKVASHLVYREFLVDTLRQRMTRKYVKNIDEKQKAAGQKWGEEIADHIIKWANDDGYSATRNMPKYQPIDGEDKWVPTQPMYGEALEPHWFKIRPFTINSSDQFRLELPIQFSVKKNSDFYKAALEVYEITKKTDEKAMDVALYWDCNPGPVMTKGHVMKVRKQNTPGGHWMGIHGILAKEKKQTLLEASQTSAQLMAGVSDAFIAAWDTKFHHHLLRPETYINRHIDSDWKPKLESPLFPEFASAHSSVSGVAASILMATYGEQAFYDDTNTGFNLPAKKFDNVWQAAEEAAKSRFIGGIHLKRSFKSKKNSTSLYYKLQSS